ncbi:helix-turn-helix domain-containing protein [Streptomyces sp. M19]
MTTRGRGRRGRDTPVCVRFHAAIELIGSRWSGAIIQALFTGRHRFAHIRAAIPGLSDTMLAQRLRTLEGAGLIERRVIPDSPYRSSTTSPRRAGNWSRCWVRWSPGRTSGSRCREFAAGCGGGGAAEAGRRAG